VVFYWGSRDFRPRLTVERSIAKRRKQETNGVGAGEIACQRLVRQGGV
jgi:hypothetical protein